ncbi:hypothetical protein ABFX02_07G095200 [Erythranthe guttata]
MDSVKLAADDETTRMETRDAPPTHLLIKIESFSLLENNIEFDKYVTKEFKAGKYKWRLIIYPNGEDNGGDNDHVSVNLAMVATSSMPANWEINVMFNIFILNHNSGNYLCSARTRRFHAMKMEWGFSKFISKKILCDPSKGFLVNGNCVFGAEVFVLKSKAVTECLSLKNVVTPYKGNWNISKFSKRGGVWRARTISVGGYKWEIWVYPKGDWIGSGRDVSVYLYNVTPFLSERIKARFTIWFENHFSKECIKRTGDSNFWFTNSTRAWGWSSFAEIATINDPSKGFVLNDSCLINIELSIQAIAKRSSPSIFN